jgi:hypothetical protein
VRLDSSGRQRSETRDQRQKAPRETEIRDKRSETEGEAIATGDKEIRDGTADGDKRKRVQQ